MSKLISIFDKKCNYIENTMGLVKAILNWLGPWVVCVQNSGGSKPGVRGIECPAIEWSQSIIGGLTNIDQRYRYLYL